MAAKVKLQPKRDQIEAKDQTWLNLGDLRSMVKLADEHGWADDCLVSHGRGSGDHPSIRGLHTATQLVVEGPV